MTVFEITFYGIKNIRCLKLSRNINKGVVVSANYKKKRW